MTDDETTAIDVIDAMQAAIAAQAEYNEAADGGEYSWDWKGTWYDALKKGKDNAEAVLAKYVDQRIEAALDAHNISFLHTSDDGDDE